MMMMMMRECADVKLRRALFPWDAWTASAVALSNVVRRRAEAAANALCRAGARSPAALFGTRRATRVVLLVLALAASLWLHALVSIRAIETFFAETSDFAYVKADLRWLRKWIEEFVALLWTERSTRVILLIFGALSRCLLLCTIFA